MTKRIRFFSTFLSLILIALMAGVWAERSAADMYKWVDENGVAHFSDAPPAGAGDAKIETLPTYATHEKNAHAQGNAFPENRGDASASADPARNQSVRTDPQVELYTTRWCSWCKKAKAFFRSRGIVFVEYDIEKDKAAAQRKDQMDSRQGVPFAVINGEGIHGYDEEAYAIALGR